MHNQRQDLKKASALILRKVENPSCSEAIRPKRFKDKLMIDLDFASATPIKNGNNMSYLMKTIYSPSNSWFLVKKVTSLYDYK